MPTRSEILFEASLRVIPGGVNSPVRAFRAVGGTPRFFARGKGAYLSERLVLSGPCGIGGVAGGLGNLRTFLQR